MECGRSRGAGGDISFGSVKEETKMPTQEIPPEEWTTFLDRLSQQHEGGLSTLEILGSDIGAQREARNLPLEGITTSKTGEPEAIAISLGKTAEDRVALSVVSHAPCSVEVVRRKEKDQ
jgi:Family of unknown function (DUF5335)